LPSNVHSPTTAFDGNAPMRLVSAATTLASRVLPPSSVVIDWSSMTMTAGAVAGAVSMSARVARIESSPTDRVDGSAGKLATVLLGGLTPAARKPALASAASWSGLRMNRANALAAVTCSCDNHEPLSSTAG
jgi:hypothetical protein